MLRELCGDGALKNVILVTNMWGKAPVDVGEAREKQLTTNFFRPALDKGAQLARHNNTVQSAHDIIRHIMKYQPIALQIQRELVDERKHIVGTSACKAVNKERNEQLRRHQVELKAIKEGVKTLKEKEVEARQELEVEKRRLQGQMNKIWRHSEGMASNHNTEKKRMEEAMRQVREEVLREREQIEAACKHQMADLSRRLRDSTSEREVMQKRIDVLQRQLDQSRTQRNSPCVICQDEEANVAVVDCG